MAVISVTRNLSKRFLAAVTDPLLSLVYPQHCGTCRGSVDAHNLGVTCGECWDATRIFTGDESLCDRCGSVLGDSSGAAVARCGRCEFHHYDRSRAVGVYERAIHDAVLRLKTAPVLSARISNQIARAAELWDFGSTDVIVPVPLSKKRFAERGHNQAALIGEVVSRRLSIDMDVAALERIKDTPMHRVGMDDKARELTVNKAFRVAHPRVVAGRNVLLVDDVFTSGATASACARALKKSGASRVSVFTLGRAVMLK